MGGPAIMWVILVGVRLILNDSIFRPIRSKMLHIYMYLGVTVWNLLIWTDGRPTQTIWAAAFINGIWTYDRAGLCLTGYAVRAPKSWNQRWILTLKYVYSKRNVSHPTCFVFIIYRMFFIVNFDCKWICLPQAHKQGFLHWYVQVSVENIFYIATMNRSCQHMDGFKS